MSLRPGRLVLLLGALALTLLATWPLARCLGSCLGEPPDTLLSVYFLSWVAHALRTPGVRLLDATLFAPYPGTLALGEYMPGYAVVAVPILALTGNPVAAHSALLILSHTLAAVGAVALTLRLTGTLGPALIAGVVFAYAPRLLDQAYNVQTLAVFWFPWLLLTLERALERPTWGRAASVGAIWLALALASLNVFVYASLLAVVFVATAVAAGRRRVGRAHLVRLGAVGIAVTALVLVYLAPNRALAREWGLGRTLGEVERYSASLADYLAVPREDLLRRLVGIPKMPPHEGVVPGVTVTALAAAGVLAAGRNWRGLRPVLAPYLAVWAVAALLALGPTLPTRLGPLPLPYRALYAAVPGFDAIRAPRRFLVFVDLGFAVLASVGAAWWLSRLGARGRQAVPAALVGLVLLESIAVPYPGGVPRLDPAAVPAVYRWLARQDPGILALEIPMGDWANVAAAAFHLRPTVNGWSSFEPPHYAALTRVMEGFPDERSVALVRGLGVDVVLVDRRWLTPARVAALAAVAPALRPEREFPTHVVLRVTPGGRPGVETLEATAGLVAPAAGGAGQLCLTLRNPGPGFVPLYPLHRLHLWPEAGGSRGADGALRWLPLDLGPGAAETACVAPSARPLPVRLRGEVEDGRRAYRFTLPVDGRSHPVGTAAPDPVSPDPGVRR